MVLEYYRRKSLEVGNIPAAQGAQALKDTHGDLDFPGVDDATRQSATDQPFIIDLETTPPTPELMTALFQAIWKTRQERLKIAGIEFPLTIDECPYTNEELRTLKAEGRMVGVLPPELSKPESLDRLGKIFPKMELRGNKIKYITNESDESGWFDYSIKTQSEYRNMTAEQQAKAMRDKGRAGMNLNQFIVATQDNNLLIGRYLDEIEGQARLPGSLCGSAVLGVCIYPSGELQTPWSYPKSPSDNWSAHDRGIAKSSPLST